MAIKGIVLQSSTRLGIYDRRFGVIVAETEDDMKLLWIKLTGEEFGKDGWLDGFYSQRLTWFRVVFLKTALSHNLIAHELFHCTHRILQDTGDTFSSEHHEPYSYLNGWLTGWVHKQLTKAKLRVK